MASYNLVAPPSTESSMLDIPPQYLTGGGDGITTRPTSARTSYTRVERTTRPGSIADQESIQGDDEQGPQGDVEPEVPADPQASVTFLLVSGKRRTMTFQPELTVGRVKELVWNSWPTEWQDDRPPAPTYLRLLYLGKLLQDDETLAKLNLATHIPTTASSSEPPHSTIIHLSIRPHGAAAAEDDLQKKKGRRRRGRSDGEGTDGEEAPATGCCSGCLIC